MPGKDLPGSRSDIQEKQVPDEPGESKRARVPAYGGRANSTDVGSPGFTKRSVY
jgi:hypothetical protein